LKVFDTHPGLLERDCDRYCLILGFFSLARGQIEGSGIFDDLTC
jgi:hypothetical protein